MPSAEGVSPALPSMCSVLGESSGVAGAMPGPAFDPTGTGGCFSSVGGMGATLFRLGRGDVARALMMADFTECSEAARNWQVGVKGGSE